MNSDLNQESRDIKVYWYDVELGFSSWFYTYMMTNEYWHMSVKDAETLTKKHWVDLIECIREFQKNDTAPTSPTSRVKVE